VGVPTYALWAMVLDPRTKRMISKVLYDTSIWRLCRDVFFAVLEIAQRELPDNGHGDNQVIQPDEDSNGSQQQQQRCQRRRKTGSNFLTDFFMMMVMKQVLKMKLMVSYSWNVKCWHTKHVEDVH
jgi:hypothetical protein